MPRAPSSKPSGSRNKRVAAAKPTLASQLEADAATAKFGLVSAPGRRASKKGAADDDEGADELPASLRVTSSKAGGRAGERQGFVDAKLSRNILRLAREQADELELEAEEAAGSGRAAAPRDAGMKDLDAFSDDEDDGEAMSASGSLRSDEAGSQYAYEEYEEIDPADAALLARFAEEHEGAEGEGREPTGTLADLIMGKIAEAEEADQQGAGKKVRIAAREEQDGPMLPPGVNEKVAEVYTKVGDLLSRYKSGPLPKAFKIIPSLPQWDSIVYLTNPSAWTPHATLAATRIFVSNLKPAQSQKFFRFVLLPKFRDEVEETGKCSAQIYEACAKSVYKPAAFFKGLLFPLCESGCTLKEAAILSSVLSRVSIPVLHSAAALLRLAEMHYRGPTSLFIRVLLDKKYALPYKVVDALVFHFLRFADPDMGVEKTPDGEKRMPVLWHQSWLVFCQRYKQDLTPDQKAALLDLLRVQKHDSIGLEIRRELTTGKARGEMLDEPIDEDDAMSI